MVKVKEIKRDVCRCHQRGGQVQEQGCHSEDQSRGRNGLTKIPQNPARTKAQSAGRVYTFCSASVRPRLGTASGFETTSQNKHQQTRAGSGSTTKTVGLKHLPCIVRLWGQGWLNPKQRQFWGPQQPLGAYKEGIKRLGPGFSQQCLVKVLPEVQHHQLKLERFGLEMRKSFFPCVDRQQ